MAPLRSNYDSNGAPYNLPAVRDYPITHFHNTNNRYYQNVLEAASKVELVKGEGIPCIVDHLVISPKGGDWVIVRPSVLRLSIGQVIGWEVGNARRTRWTAILVAEKSFTDEYVCYSACRVADPWEVMYDIDVWCPIAWAYIHNLPRPTALIGFMSYGGTTSNGGSDSDCRVVREPSVVATDGSGSEGGMGASFLTMSAHSSEAGAWAAPPSGRVQVQGRRAGRGVLWGACGGL